MKKIIFSSFVILIIVLIISLTYLITYKPDMFSYLFIEKVEVEKIYATQDYDNDGIVDSEDILLGARNDAKNKPNYKSVYYNGGYPPDNEGVCADVIWRAFKEAGYNLKELIDEDIKENINDYPRVGGKPDTNIDFRRVPNLKVFFDKYAQSLTNEINENDIENLKQWQGGDIVVFQGKNIPDHIAIVSDKRNVNGVPYIIHNSSPYTREADELKLWNDNIGKIVGHYRFWK